MPRFDFSQAAVGTAVQDPLLVLQVEEKSYDRSSYAILTLGNATGSLKTSPFWDAAQSEVAGLGKGDVVQVIGTVAEYRGRLQLQVKSIRPLPRGSFSPADFLPSAGDVARYWDLLDEAREKIAGPRLRKVLGLFFDDEGFRERFEQCPASTVGHHAMLGGLLRHTTEIAVIGRTIAKTVRADGDLVLAGALLHDIGKLESYRWDTAFDYTDPGRLLGHVVLGALMLDRRLNAEPQLPCTALERELLLHLILSHHGKLEFGAAVPPMTLEAEILHYADNASAKTTSMAEAVTRATNFPGDAMFSEPLWDLDRRRAYRGASDWGAGEKPS